MTELCSQSILCLFAYLKGYGLGQCTGISFVDSTPLRICQNRQHKTFKGIAQRGQCSIGWFYGFKLHMINNDRENWWMFILLLVMWMIVNHSELNRLFINFDGNFLVIKDISEKISYRTVYLRDPHGN